MYLFIIMWEVKGASLSSQLVGRRLYKSHCSSGYNLFLSNGNEI